MTAVDIAVVNGIRTYKTTVLFDQKLEAAADRPNVRVLCDLGFLASAYGNRFPTEQIMRADVFTRNHENLAGRFDSAFQASGLLRVRCKAEDWVLLFRIAVVEQTLQRGH